jgi:hypothetical protein
LLTHFLDHGGQPFIVFGQVSHLLLCPTKFFGNLPAGVIDLDVGKLQNDLLQFRR